MERSSGIGAESRSSAGRLSPEIPRQSAHVQKMWKLLAAGKLNDTQKQWFLPIGKEQLFDMEKLFWPGGKQPDTVAPAIAVVDGQASVTAAEPAPRSVSA